MSFLSEKDKQFIGHVKHADPNLWDCLNDLIDDVGHNSTTIVKINNLLTAAGIVPGKNTLSFKAVMKRISLRA